MSRFEDRIAAPPALPPIRPPRRRGDDRDPSPEGPRELPLWIRPGRIGPISRVGVKFPAFKGDSRSFTARSLALTTCIVLKIIPPGARRSAAILSPAGYYTGWGALPRLKRQPRFKTKAEKKRSSRRWLHGATREREFLLIGPRCVTIAPARYMMEKTRWSIRVKLKIAVP
jgi:hypothetical protein